MTLRDLYSLARNITSLLTSDVVNRATTFVLYALVARHLGALAFGQMSLALGIFYLFQGVAAAGLKTLVTREVARDRGNTADYLTNGLLVASVSSLLSMALLALMVRLLDYAPDTAEVILLLSLGLLPVSLVAVWEAIFQAWERMQYIAYANLLVSLGRVALAFWMISLGFGLRDLILLILLSHCAAAAIEGFLVLRRIAGPSR